MNQKMGSNKFTILTDEFSGKLPPQKINGFFLEELQFSVVRRNRIKEGRSSYVQLLNQTRNQNHPMLKSFLFRVGLAAVTKSAHCHCSEVRPVLFGQAFVFLSKLTVKGKSPAQLLFGEKNRLNHQDSFATQLLVPLR